MPTVQIAIHPDAKERFDTDATALLAYVAERPQPRPVPPAFPDDIDAPEIPDEDVKDLRSEIRDESGQIVERRFTASERSYALSRDGCTAMDTLAQRLCRNRDLSSLVSRAFVENTILSWVIHKVETPSIGLTFFEFFSRRAEEAIKTFTVWTPIANLIVQTPIRFGSSTIQTLPATTVQQWEANSLSKIDDVNREFVAGYFAKVKKFFQGYAAFVSTVLAEPSRVEEYAYEEADRALALLGVFSGAALHPNAKCPFSMRGTWSVPGATFILENEGSIHGIRSGVRGHVSGMLILRWSDADIERLRSHGLETASALLALTKLNDFQAAILNALFLYARAAYADEPIDKVVHVLSSLESMMLKDENEPIQQNLGERIAVFTQTDLNARKAVIQRIKAAYRLRSRYLHHGIPASDHTIIHDLLVIAWIFYVKLLTVADSHQRRLDFVQGIDDAKLS